MFYEAVKTDFISYVAVDYCNDFAESWVSFVSKYSEEFPALIGDGRRERNFVHLIERPDLKDNSVAFTGLSIIEQSTGTGNLRINYDNFSSTDGYVTYD